MGQYLEQRRTDTEQRSEALKQCLGQQGPASGISHIVERMRLVRRAAIGEPVQWSVTLRVDGQVYVQTRGDDGSSDLYRRDHGERIHLYDAKRCQGPG